jgi:hypothetical protein
MPGDQLTRSLVRKVKSTRVSHHRFAERSGIPRAMVLTISFVLAPETGLVCLRFLVRCVSIVTTISASGYQAHTTSPSARLRSRQQRKLASIASRPAFVTIASRPSGGTRRTGL